MYINVLIPLLYLLNFCDSYNVLLFFPWPIKSLSILGEGYVNHLLSAGHQVTYVSAFPSKKTSAKNFRQVDISELVDYFTLLDDEYTNITKTIEQQGEPVGGEDYQEFGTLIGTLVLENKNVKAFLEEDLKFDVVIADLYETEVFVGLSALYDCPMIWSYSMGAHWLVLRLIDEATNPAYTAHYLSDNVPPLNFVQRIQELWSQIKWKAIKKFSTVQAEEKLYRQTFEHLTKKNGRALPTYQDVVYNVSLILANDHTTFGNIPSTPQNFKFIGGQHIETPTKPLTQDLQTLIDNSKHGIIYFSLGSTWKSKNIPNSITQGLLKVFGKLKQTVIWKYEADLTDLPKNIHILKWAPQQSILNHPNCLFFISHGGLLSSTESIHFGVPIIGVPIAFDQHININKAVLNGYAIKVDLSYNLPEDLETAVNTMLTDSKYKEKAKQLSAIYHDRVVPPGAELVHWVEHVVRTRGAPHLRSPALHVPWYQKMYLDLAALIAAVLFVIKISMCIVIEKIKPKKINISPKKRQ